MQPSPSEPFFLLDESLSSRIAPIVSGTTGHLISTIWDEWRGRNFSADPLPDEEIISHLGEKASHRALWITADWGARRQHRTLIDCSLISVLWLRGPGGGGLSVHNQSFILQSVMGAVHQLMLECDAPVYLRARFQRDDGDQAFLERLQGTLLEQSSWERIPVA